MSYAYVVTGTPYKMQDGAGMAITVATDPSTNYAVPTALTPNSNSNLTSSMTYDATYSLTSVTGANGSTQGVAYDGLQRLASASTPDGLVTAYSYTYGPNTQTATITTTTTTQTSSCPPATNCLLWNMSNPPTTTTTTSTRWTRNTLDGFGRTIKVETGHDSNVVVSTADTLYAACGCSPLGKPYKTSYPYGPGETEVWTTYTFDGSGRQLTSTAPDGSVTTTSYLGNTVTATDPAGIWKKNTMDAFGNAVAVSEPDPATGSASTGPVTNYTYNGANQITGVSMTRGGVTQTRSFVWNGSDLVSETTPEAGTVSYTYDGNHHVTQRIDALNQKTAYTYDAYERLTMVQHYTWGFSPQCTSNCVNQWNEQASQDVSYYYDYPVSSDYTQNNTWGRLTGVLFTAQAAQNQPAFAYEYSYNQAGRVTGNRMLVKEAPGSPGLDLQAQYAWDTQGRMTSMTYPSGAAMTYGFDAMGRPITMTQIVGSQTLQAGGATYGSAGQVLSFGGAASTGTIAWNGTLTPSFASVGETLTYNSMLQLIHLTGTIASAPSEVVTTPVDIQYVYNAGHNNGRVAQTIDNVLGETVNYTYDYLHRLTGAVATSGSWGESYTFDGFGNLTGKTPVAGSAPAFTGSAGWNAQNGNLAGQWDIEKRPMTQGSTFYVYDPWGRRIWKQYNGTSGEAYFYGVTGQKLETYNCTVGSNGVSGTLEGINTYFVGRMISEKGVVVATDRLGSVRGDNNGVAMSYFPWGEERGAGTADNRTKFAGYFRDMPGQDYANARYYTAVSGSFWSPDPIAMGDSAIPNGWNRYAYAGADPVNNSDPTGMLVAWTDEGNCGPGWMWDASLSGPCCDPTSNGYLGSAPDPGCYAGGGDDSGSVNDDEPDPFVCPAQYQAWIDAHGADSASVATSLGINEGEILGLSSVESAWGAGRFAQEGNDFFNLEKTKTKRNRNPSLLPFSNGWLPAKGNPNQLVATYANFLDSAKSFAAVDGKYIRGVTDPTKFAQSLQDLAKFGQGANGPVPYFVSTVAHRINVFNECLGN